MTGGFPSQRLCNMYLWYYLWYYLQQAVKNSQQPVIWENMTELMSMLCDNLDVGGLQLNTWADGHLTHWGRVTHICVCNLTIIGPDNGLLPGRRQAIIWTNAGILLIGPLGTNFSETVIEIHIFSFKKMHLKISSAKWRLFCLGLNELRMDWWTNVTGHLNIPSSCRLKVNRLTHGAFG